MKVYKYTLVVVARGNTCGFYTRSISAKKLDDAFDLVKDHFNGDGQLEDYFAALEVTDEEDSVWGSITEVYKTRQV